MSRFSNNLQEGYELHGKRRTYTIISTLGSGGFGITYKVRAIVNNGNITSTVYFCVKEFFPANDCERLPDATISYSNPARKRVESAKADFISEAQRLGRIGFSHPNIVGFDEVFEANNTAYYVMEFIEGPSLRDYIEKHGALSEEETRKIMWPILHAMTSLHQSSICHLDIKPGNIMLGQDNLGRLRPVLIDFGLSKHYDNLGQPTTTVKTVGVSEGYSPREQYSGIDSFSPESDIYALGATLWHCLTGRIPKSSLLLEDNELAEALPLHVSQEMRSLISRMTSGIRKRPKSIDVLGIDYNRNVFINGNATGNTSNNDDNDNTNSYGSQSYYDSTKIISKQRNGNSKKSIILAVIIGVVILLSIVFGILYSMRPKHPSAKISDTTITTTDTADSTKQDTNVEDTLPLPEDMKENMVLSNEEAVSTVRKLWKGVPDHGINSYTKSCLSPSFYSIVKKGFDLQQRIQSQIEDLGPGEDLYYWYEGNGGDGIGITDISVTTVTPEKFAALVKYNDGGEITSHAVEVIKIEDGSWRINDFDNMRYVFNEFIKDPYDGYVAY